MLKYSGLSEATRLKKLYDSAEANGFISTINKFSLHKYFILPVDHLSVKLPVQRHEERGFLHSAPKVQLKWLFIIEVPPWFSKTICTFFCITRRKITAIRHLAFVYFSNFGFNFLPKNFTISRRQLKNSGFEKKGFKLC